jgi:predicted exporter/lauroyl/myristoyl acyltransferase
MPLLRSPSAALFLLVVLGAGIWSALTIRFETELLPVLPPQLPSVRGLDEFSRLAAGDHEIYAVPDPALSAEERGELLAKTRAALAKLPGVASVSTTQETLAEHSGILAAWLLLNSPPEVFASTMEKLGDRSVRDRLASIPARLTGAVDPVEIVQLQIDPLGLLPASGPAPALSPGVSEFLIITPARTLAGAAADAEFVDSLRAALRSALPPGEAEHVLLTGHPVFNADISRQMRRDMILMIAVATALLLAAFYLFYRTLRPLGWIILLQFFALLAGLVAARILYGGLNVISIGFASILLGVGMDYSILVYHHFGSPHRNDTRVWHTLRRAIWFSALVTAAAFYFLALTSFPALQQLGVLVGTGLLASALMATWPLRLILAARPPEAPRALFRASNRAAEIILRHRGLILGLGCALLAGIFWFRPWAPASGFYQPNLDKLRPVGSEAYTAQEWLQQLDPTAAEAIYVLRASDHDTIRRTAPSLAHAVLPESKTDASWNIPSESARIANLAVWPRNTAGRLETAFAEAGLGAEWSNQTLQMARAIEQASLGQQDAFAQIAPILRTMAGHDGEDAYAILRLPGAAENPVPPGGWSQLDPSVEILPVSWVSLTAEVTALAQRDFTRLGLAMLGAIVVLCALAQRSWRMVGLNFLALALAAGLCLGLMRLTGTSLTPLSLISLPLLVGLVVDYSLHVLMALHNQKGDLSKTYDHLAAPILLTGISACIGFGAPALTGQPALQNFGLVMDLGIISAVAAGLILLPPFYLIGRKRDYRERKFYRALYQKRGFEWILLGWRLLGERGAWLVSRTLGLFYALTHPATVQAVRDNLSLLDARKATFFSACRLFMNQAENFSTYGRLSVRPTSDVVDMMGFRQGFEHLQRARDRGQGCLLVTGHLGFFELGGLIMAQLGFPMTALTLPEPTTALTEWRAEFRARWGVKTIVVGNDSFSVLDIVRSLQGGAFVASLADRPYDGNSVPVELPHGRIPFSTGPVLLALLAGCPIVPVGITRQPDGQYHIEARAFIEPVWLPEGREETLRHYTREVAAALTPLFVAYPEQWYHFAPLRCD